MNGYGCRESVVCGMERGSAVNPWIYKSDVKRFSTGTRGDTFESSMYISRPTHESVAA